jgi:hypothetical protein
MNKIVLGFLALFSAWAVAATNVPTSQASKLTRDQQQSAGGWEQDCNSGNVTCDSGRVIGCNATLNGSVGGSECTQHTGSAGWVDCYTYDSTGASTSSYYDECP